MNDLKRNKVELPNVTINTKFLNCLQPEWYKAKKDAKTHDPLALVAHTSSSSSRSPPPYYVIHPYSVVDYDDDYYREISSDDQEDSLTSTMMLLSCAITQRYSKLTNNRILTSLNTRNQVVVQSDRVNIQSRNVRNGGRLARRSYNTQEEPSESSNVLKETGNPRVHDYKCFMVQMLLAKKDEARVIISNEQNEFLLADAAQMEEIEELRTNICMIAIIQQETSDSDKGPSYDSTFINEVQTPLTGFMNMLFSNSDHEQTYHEQPKIVNSTNDDQINIDIIFDDLNVEINDRYVEHEKMLMINMIMNWNY
uniref:Gag-Pol polyprotein n=1 Tax=Tanacetum cinerariifolium TaxID=118510 RepID=A0A6L2J2J9_TANCI|nr:hypothetical protein [Tanacetum cinerariifolium]